MDWGSRASSSASPSMLNMAFGSQMDAAISSPNDCTSNSLGLSNVPVPFDSPSMMRAMAWSNPYQNRLSPNLGEATHEELIQAGNRDHTGLFNAYNKLLGQHDTLKDAYLTMAKAMPQLFSIIPNPLNITIPHSSNPSAVSLPSLPLLTPLPPLDQKDYPEIQFWTVESWNAHNKKEELAGPHQKDPQRGRARVAKGENVSGLFIEDTNGVPISGYRLTELKSHARSIFNHFQTQGHAPNVWGDATVLQVTFYRREMYEKFPELRYCQGTWKVDKVATEVYYAWRKAKRTKEEPEDDDKKLLGKRKQGTNHDSQPSAKKRKVTPEPPTPAISSSPVCSVVPLSSSPISTSPSDSPFGPTTPSVTKTANIYPDPVHAPTPTPTPTATAPTAPRIASNILPSTTGEPASMPSTSSAEPNPSTPANAYPSTFSSEDTIRSDSIPVANAATALVTPLRNDIQVQVPQTPSAPTSVPAQHRLKLVNPLSNPSKKPFTTRVPTAIPTKGKSAPVKTAGAKPKLMKPTENNTARNLYAIDYCASHPGTTTAEFAEVWKGVLQERDTLQKYKDMAEARNKAGGILGQAAGGDNVGDV